MDLRVNHPVSALLKTLKRVLLHVVGVVKEVVMIKKKERLDIKDKVHFAPSKLFSERNLSQREISTRIVSLVCYQCQRYPTVRFDWEG